VLVGRAVAVLVVALLAGCGDDDECANQVSCDVRAAECQRCVFRRMAIIYRANPASPPPVTMVTPEELAAEFSPPSRPSPEDLAQTDSLRRLGLAPPDAMTSPYDGTVFAAFYDRKAKTFEVAVAMWEIAALPAEAARGLATAINGRAAPTGAWRARSDGGRLTVLAARSADELAPWLALLGTTARSPGSSLARPFAPGLHGGFAPSSKLPASAR